MHTLLQKHVALVVQPHVPATKPHVPWPYCIEPSTFMLLHLVVIGAKGAIANNFPSREDEVPAAPVPP